MLDRGPARLCGGPIVEPDVFLFFQKLQKPRPSLPWDDDRPLLADLDLLDFELLHGSLLVSFAAGPHRDDHAIL
jgi:hypothetical protein